jgi:RNA polymerase subunit RPABC4/transcription elongation factor Spt4
VMIAYASSGGLVPCRFCRSKISKQARVCPKCGRDVWN